MDITYERDGAYNSVKHITVDKLYQPPDNRNMDIMYEDMEQETK